MTRDRFNSEGFVNVKLRLIRNRNTDGIRYNLSIASKVTALIPGDIDPDNLERDIILETQSGLLRRISELYTAYLPLQYSLLFSYGEDGYRDDVPLREQEGTSSRKRNKVTRRQFFTYRIQDRNFEADTILCSRKLFQQFIVDAYTMVESQ
ncbi:uncharacterized protein LOC119998547 [Tripterygium wilfordii]|uniref:uncharacterized protein LOC119998547 n=1 Tax=Tripterygium wilfordii TaxID=458696 RepID=UPI0018F81397|nr:uncharacterized protein LOC119998547 [Tripterygium wilfordii]